MIQVRDGIGITENNSSVNENSLFFRKMKRA